MLDFPITRSHITNNNKVLTDVDAVQVRIICRIYVYVFVHREMETKTKGASTSST